MSAANNRMTRWGRAAVIAVLPLVMGIMAGSEPRSYAQAQAQPDAQATVAPAESEVPAAVAKKLQAMETRIGQLDLRLNNLAASIAPHPTAAVRPVGTAAPEITLTGKVSCGHCEGIQPMHKGYTQFSWALHSVSQGDDMVLIAHDKTYKLQGNKNKLLVFMCDKAKVSGRLDAATLEVETINRATTRE